MPKKISELEKLALNNPCSCGSELQGKDCCLNNEIKRRYPDYMEIYEDLSKAKLLVIEQKFKEAEDIYYDILKNHPHFPGAYYALCVIAYSFANQKAVLILLELAVKFSPYNQVYLHNLAAIYLETGGFNQALALYNRLNKIDSKNALYYECVSNCFRGLGDDKKADKYMAKAKKYREEVVVG